MRLKFDKKNMVIETEIWTEKYRPKRIDEIVGQNEITKRLKLYIQSKNMPHLLFSGPPGTGKTASGIALAREFFGDDWQFNFVELNASDERGLPIVRNKIKNFARTSPIGDGPFKLMFLDEADALTPDAQNALRRTMEIHTRVCRFIISCNYSSKIIEPIQSRCAVYRFKPISDAAMEERIKYISRIENLELTQAAYETIKYIAQGDMRRALNALQGASMINKKIDSDDIYKASSMARPEDIAELINFGLKGNFSKSKEKMKYLILDMGISADEIVRQIYRSVLETNIPDKLKADIINQIGEVDFRIAEGSNENIQLDTLISKLILLAKI